jgi:hypothetical protein
MEYQVRAEERSRTVQDVSRCILQYLHDYPEAQDTIEGIATWWIMRQRISETVSIVQEALQQLENEGHIATNRAPGGRILYSVKSG